MTFDIDTGTIAVAIIAGFSAHAVFVKLSIDKAVEKLGKEIAKEYATKEDLVNHVDTWHKD